jgi:PAS domain S-box-containing protein
MPEPRDDERVGAHESLNPISGIDGITAAWHRTADALHETERRYRELVEHSLGLICTHDLTGIILSVNPAAATLLGYRPEEGVGHNLRDFISPETRHLFDDYLQRIQDRGQDAGVMRVVGRSGEARFWMYRNVLSRDRSGTPYVLGHALDITERIVAERTLRDSEEALRAAHAELEARVQERTAALERTNDRLHAEILERQRAEDSRERALIEQRDTLGFLAVFSDRLAPILTFDELVGILPRLTVPWPADWTMIHVLDDDGSVRCVAGEHHDVGRQPLLARLVAECGASLSSDCLVASVFTTGRLTIIRSDADLAERLLGPGPAAPHLERLGAGAAALIPLLVAGRTRGVLSLLSARPEHFTAANALVVEDLTRRVRLTLDRIQLYREAQDASRLKDEFLSTLSHELRTPLNAIFGWARILRTRDLDKSTAHAVEVIERNAEAQVRLIDDVLDVSRIIIGKMRLAMEQVDLRAILHATIDAVRPSIQAKGIQFSEVIEGDVPAVLGDSHRLQQVFWNLLSNALKFTGPDGAISIRLRAIGRAVEFTIVDTGVGIRRDVLPFVFDRFRQADSSTTRTHGGLGLGLAIVRHIVELHGGGVTAESAGEGRGATFTIRFPIADRRPAPESRPLSEAPSPPAEPSLVLRDRTVLIVEDHDDARELIAAVLEAAGARVLSASSTAEALKEARDVRPDLLLADIGLPGEDGYMLLKKLRAIHGADLPAIALTAYARASDRERALAAGFQQHVLKPVDPAQLVMTIVSLL